MTPCTIEISDIALFSHYTKNCLKGLLVTPQTVMQQYSNI